MSSSIYEQIPQDWSEEDRKKFPSSSFQFHSSLGSTNTLLREQLLSEKAGQFSLIVADHQTEGRGRRGAARVAQRVARSRPRLRASRHQGGPLGPSGEPRIVADHRDLLVAF